ncbi:hypothetical protein ACWD3I_45445 [Streptomyces sp. NPDC002817]|uniref:hypothetical protein n=1 Tax=Streptomyces sp. NPDC088357 TaxID=3154655 RepID=UPI003448FD79
MAEPETYAVLFRDGEPHAAVLTQVGDRTPDVVLDGLPRDMAEAAVAELVAAGAEAEVRAGRRPSCPVSGDSLG